MSLSPSSMDKLQLPLATPHSPNRPTIDSPPAKLTKRIKSAKYKAGSSRHATTSDVGTTINIINNFGMGSINHFSDWKDTAKKNRGVKVSWRLVRGCLGVVLVVWAGAMMTVLRSGSSASVGKKKVHPRQLLKGVAPVATLKDHQNAFVAKAKEASVTPNSKKGDDEDEESSDYSTAGDDTIDFDPRMASSLTATGQDVAYSLTHPSDFKFDSPNAPSCSVPLTKEEVSFTLVSQLSNDRMWMIPYHCKRWGNHPISVVVFSNRDAAQVKANAVKEGCTDEQLTVQTVSRTKYDPTGTEYPVNILRNLALSAVKTSHVVYADVDFWPAENLYDILMMESAREKFASDPYLATVVPAFQMARQCTQWRDCRNKNIPVMPKDKEALLALVQKRKASSFDPTNTGGHGSTKYLTWRDQEEGSFVDIPCIKSNRYEPYLAIRYCSDLPPFQEGFTGYGKNKMTWAMQLRKTGYKFSQLGGAFLVHYPHLDSKSREEWNKKPDALWTKPLHDLDGESKEKIDWGAFKRARVDALFLDFRKWLDEEVEDESRVPICQDAQNDDMRLWVPPGKTSDA